MSESSSTKTPDLARIRDNQRRSRARRKEYLQELESKYRICERTGAEASSEIQAAAREVAAENKRLRLLLQQHGIADPDLPREPGQHSSSAHQSPSAASLDRALRTPKPCGGSSERGGSAPAVSSAGGRALMPRQQPSQQSPQQHSPQEQSPRVQEIPSQQQQEPYLPYATGTTSAFNHFASPQLQQHYIDDSNSTSCYDLASVIRTVRPYMGSELEASMGCADGRECAIPNARAFDLLDRYSETGQNCG